MRRLYGVSWEQAGQPALPWREAHALVLAAIQDPSTPLGAEAAGWDYPAREIDLLLLMSLGADPKVLPFTPTSSDPPPAPPNDDAGDGEDLEALAAAAAADLQALITIATE